MQKRTYFLSKMAKYIGSLEKNLVCSKKSLLFTLLKYSLFSNADNIYVFLLYLHLLFIQEESSFATGVCQTLGLQRLRPYLINSSSPRMSLLDWLYGGCTEDLSSKTSVVFSLHIFHFKNTDQFFRKPNN